MANDGVDIGGVTLLRAAAKNHARVTVVVSPHQYHDFLSELESKGEISQTTREKYALKAFEHTAAYDKAISDFFRRKYASSGEGMQHLSLRYGTNPHQKPASAFTLGEPLPFKVLSGAAGRNHHCHDTASCVADLTQATSISSTRLTHGDLSRNSALRSTFPPPPPSNTSLPLVRLSVYPYMMPNVRCIW